MWSMRFLVLVIFAATVALLISVVPGMDEFFRELIK